MDLYHFKDSKPTPDKMFAYTDDFKGVPLIIDNGSYTAKVGWGSQLEPAMIFKNLITKVRKDRTKKDLETQIGNDIVNVEAGRLNLRTQFDRGVVTHFEAQETLLDYSLTHLGVNTPGGLQHPVVISEPPANLNFSRAAMSELLFECYRVPSVSYYVDALASLLHNQPQCREALVISCGYHATHVIPVLDGRMEAANTRRISVGGFLMCSYLQRLLQLKWPSVMASITLSRAEELLHELARFSTDFSADLALWTEPSYREQHTRRLQLPVSAAASSASASSGPDQPPPDQRDKKLSAKARMLEMHRKKRQAMVSEDERRLAQLRQSGQVDPELLQELQERIEAGRAKVADLAARGRQTTPRPPPADLEARLQQLERRRRELLDRRAERRQRRSEMARRRTAASQQRMRIITQLAQRDSKDDTFGQRDEDWDVYKSINVDGGDSDSEADTEELTEVESRLRQLAPDLPRRQTTTGSPAQLYQIQLAAEALQTTEILFQPSMLGLSQAGLAETVDFVLKKYPAAEQQRLADNVFVTGGVANIPGLLPRLERELRQMRPFQSSFRVSVAGSASLDTWRGARSLAAAGRLQAVSRQQYGECGAEYLAEHPVSNRYWPTPAEPAAPAPALAAASEPA